MTAAETAASPETMAKKNVRRRRERSSLCVPIIIILPVVADMSSPAPEAMLATSWELPAKSMNSI